MLGTGTSTKTGCIFLARAALLSHAPAVTERDVLIGSGELKQGESCTFTSPGFKYASL